MARRLVTARPAKQIRSYGDKRRITSYLLPADYDAVRTLSAITQLSCSEIILRCLRKGLPLVIQELKEEAEKEEDADE